MFARLASLALVAASLVLGGCMTTREISVSTAPNGTVTRTEKSMTGWVTAPVYAVPYGYSYGGEWDYGYGYRRYQGSRGTACTGPFGQVIDGICYHTKPHWMR